jgi:hypothetical protein
MPLTRQLYLLALSLGALVGGGVLLVRYFSGLPALDELEKVSGTVQLDAEVSSSRWGTTRYPVLVVGEPSNRFKYLEWFPKSDSVTRLVRAGERATIWTDRDENGWVWQIEQRGRLVIQYAEVRDAVASNQRFDWLLGGGMLAVGIFGFVKLWHHFQ